MQVLMSSSILSFPIPSFPGWQCLSDVLVADCMDVVSAIYTHGVLAVLKIHLLRRKKEGKYDSSFFYLLVHPGSVTGQSSG